MINLLYKLKGDENAKSTSQNKTLSMIYTCAYSGILTYIVNILCLETLNDTLKSFLNRYMRQPSQTRV